MVKLVSSMSTESVCQPAKGNTLGGIQLTVVRLELPPLELAPRQPHSISWAPLRMRWHCLLRIVGGDVAPHHGGSGAPDQELHIYPPAFGLYRSDREGVAELVRVNVLQTPAHPLMCLSIPAWFWSGRASARPLSAQALGTLLDMPVPSGTSELTE